MLDLTRGDPKCWADKPLAKRTLRYTLSIRMGAMQMTIRYDPLYCSGACERRDVVRSFGTCPECNKIWDGQPGGSARSDRHYRNNAWAICDTVLASKAVVLLAVRKLEIVRPLNPKLIAQYMNDVIHNTTLDTKTALDGISTFSIFSTIRSSVKVRCAQSQSARR